MGRSSGSIPTWDSHLHYLDFTQRTDGFPALIEQMDLIGVEAAVIFGMPIVKMWSESDPIRPDYYLDTDARAYYFSATDFILAQELLQQPEEIQDRFFPFISGINPLDLNATVVPSNLVPLPRIVRLQLQSGGVTLVALGIHCGMQQDSRHHTHHS